MYLCICHAVKESDVDRYYLIGTKCGICIKNKCIKNKKGKLNPKKYFRPFYMH